MRNIIQGRKINSFFYGTKKNKGDVVGINVQAVIKKHRKSEKINDSVLNK